MRIDRPLTALLCTVAIVDGLCMPNDCLPGDPTAMREEARAILQGRGLAIDPELAPRFGEPGQYVVLNPGDGRYYSKFGIMNGLLFLLPLAAERIFAGPLPPAISEARVLWLDGFNWALSLALAFVLYRICGFFTPRRWHAAAFVLAAFYATFLWAYLRVQGSELFQVLFFAAFVLAALRLFRDWESRSGRARAASVAWVWLWATCLALTKVSYALAGPCFAAALAMHLADRDRLAPARALLAALRWNWIPACVLVALVLGANRLRFGSFLATGYHQWKPGYHSLGGDPTQSLYGFLFSPHWSVLFHFPLLAIAAFGWRRFLVQDRTAALFLLGTTAVHLGLLSFYPGWRGEACYGPRYLLFLLPVLSMPALHVFDGVADSWSTSARAQTVALLSAGILAWSGFLQFQVIRYPFMAFYTAADSLGNVVPREMSGYFAETHYGRVNWDLRRWVDGAPFAVMQEAEKSFVPEAFAAYRKRMRELYATPNFYWLTGPRLGSNFSY